MLNILVVDSNPESQNRIVSRHGGCGLGEGYRRVLLRLDPSLDITIVAPYEDETAIDLSDYHGMVFTGSGVSWSVTEPRADCLRSLMEQGFKSGLPVFGSCNGMQLAAVVLGGAIDASPNGREDGLARHIQLTGAARQHKMMAERKPVFDALCVHRDEVTRLPAGATILAGNRHSAIQAFGYEGSDATFWGTQYHPEFAPNFLAGYLLEKGRITADEAASLSEVDSGDQAAASLQTTLPDMLFEARTLELRNWLSMLEATNGAG